MAETITNPDSPSAVLSEVREFRSMEDAAATRQLRLAVDWAAMHSVDSLADAAHLWAERYGDTGVPVAGLGAPLVAEFCVAELAAAIGVSTDAGRGYLGEAVELRYRLPRVWARVLAGDLVAWKARRIARATIHLSREAACFVDAHVAAVAHKIGPYVLDRLIEEAIARFMPEEAENRRRAAADGRRFDIDTPNTSLNGTASVWGELDVADALDLDAAVSAGAEHLKTLGSTDSLDVRRATAVGDLARHQQTLDLNTHTTDAGADLRPRRKARQVVLYVHLSDTALVHGGLGRLENIRSLITVEQVRAWCGTPRHLRGREAGDRPERACPGRRLRGPRPDARGRGPGGPHLCLPLVHQTRPRVPPRRARRGLRPHHPLRTRQLRRLDVFVQHRPVVSPAPPVEDPRRLAVHPGRTRHLPLGLTARPVVPA